VQHYTVANGLPAEQLRTVRAGRDDTLWIGTIGDGLLWRRNGRFYHASAAEGLGADNIASIVEDHAGDLWLSTPRGIWRVDRTSLEQFTAGRARTLRSEWFGVPDGLRSAQCSPTYPGGGGSAVTGDGWLWFPTGQGLALLNPAAPVPARHAPRLLIHAEEFDGKTLPIAAPAVYGPGAGRIVLRFAAIYLRAPEAVSYRFRLDGVDRDWIPAGARRSAAYSNLSPGHYLFHARAEAAGATTEQIFRFTIRPHFYETYWFAATLLAALAALLWGAWQLRVRTLRSRFHLVLDERARLARELHDTLAQDFVGLAALLDAIALGWKADTTAAAQKLELARRMVRHSLTEARRSVMDLRAAALQGQTLGEALASAAPLWSAGRSIEVRLDIAPPGAILPEETEQHLLRIAQEAVHNAARHSGAHTVTVRLRAEHDDLVLAIVDDGRGFDVSNAFDPAGGHFGILGMRERAGRIGGRLELRSTPGGGTVVEVRVRTRSQQHGER
jgi:signal transduction histidine kinase